MSKEQLNAYGTNKFHPSGFRLCHQGARRSHGRHSLSIMMLREAKTLEPPPPFVMPRVARGG